MALVRPPDDANRRKPAPERRPSPSTLVPLSPKPAVAPPASPPPPTPEPAGAVDFAVTADELTLRPLAPDEPLLHSEEPLSPELALVSPELAVEARAELPERPWEAFQRLPQAKTLRVERIERTAPVRRPAPTLPARRPARRRIRRPELPLSWLVTAGLAVFLVVTGALPANDAPTLLPKQAAKPKAAKPTAAKPTPRRAGAPPLVAGAIYVEGNRMRLRVSDGGRRLRGTTGALPCAAGGVSFATAIGRDGSFRGTVRGIRQRGATGSVLGRFGPRTTASGVVRVRHRACDSGPVLFVAGIQRPR
jgi:hypothetical protein